MATAVAAWPSTINVTNFSDYGETWDTNFAEFAPDVGPPKRRRRMSLSSETLSPVMYLTSAEVETFRTFYRDTLKDGTLAFTFPKPRTGVIEQYTFTGNAPQVKFADYGLYQVSMTWRSVPNTRASWLPLLTVGSALIPSLAPDMFADFTTEGSTDPHYWYLGNRYASFATWVAALSGGSYTRTTTAQYFQGGILQPTAAINAPRFPTDSVGNKTGLRLTENQPESCLWNRDLTNAAWTKTTATAAKTQTGIDGVANSASLLTATANNATATQTITAASSTTLTGMWVKRITGTGTIQISQDNGSTKTTIVPTASWVLYPVAAIQTLTNPVPWIGISVSGDAIAVDFVSVRRGVGCIGDPVATTTATVVQGRDALGFLASVTSLTGYVSTINFLDEGTGFFPPLFSINDGSGSCMFYQSSLVQWFDGAFGPTAAFTPSTSVHKAMVSGSPAGVTIGADGATPASNNHALVGTPPYTAIWLGPGNAGRPNAVADFRQCAFWFNQVASAADIQRITT